jgi:hypothetical protein
LYASIWLAIANCCSFGTSPQCRHHAAHQTFVAEVIESPVVAIA